MIMQKLVSSLLFISLLFICSCDKDTTVSPPDTNTTVEAYAKNPLNPYDDVGATHNELLDEILKEVFHDPSVSKDDLFKKAFDLAAERNPTANVSYDSIYVPNKTIFDGFGPTVDPTNYMTSIGMGGVGARYVTEMLDSLTPVNGTPRSSETGCIIIKGIEDRILNSTTISSSDKIIALCAASVFRHSYLYWEKNLPTWKLKFEEAGTDHCETCGFWDIAKEDGKGAVKGAVVGAVTGAGALLIGGAGGAGQSLSAAIFG